MNEDMRATIVGVPDLVKDGFIVEFKTKVEMGDIDQMILYLKLSELDDGIICDTNGNTRAWVRRIEGDKLIGYCCKCGGYIFKEDPCPFCNEPNWWKGDKK